jgi:hypothetical protein
MPLARKLLRGIDLARPVRRRNVAQEFFRDGFVFDSFTVKDKTVAAQLNRVARQSHHSLYQALPIVRREKDHDVAPVRVVPLSEVAGGERHFEVVSQLIHEHAVALEDGWLH